MRIIIISILLSLSGSAQTQVTNDIWLQAKMTGNLWLDGGGSTEFWGYGIYDPVSGPGPAIYLPGPLLRFNEGDSVNVHFLNNAPEDHTIHWHGLDVNTANDGVPTTSSTVEPDSTRVYRFLCTNAGTFNYHCHVFTTLHLAMGMYGLFVVDPDSTRTRIYTNGPRYTKDYNWLASEHNTNWSDNILSPGLLTLYQADYLMLNGKSGSQLLTGPSSVTGTTNDTIAMRLGNMGYGMVRYIFPPAADMTVYMSDGRAIPNPTNTDTIDVYSGERYSVILDPDSEFNEMVTIEYFDLRTNELLGTNLVPIIIDDLSLEENEKVPGIELLGNPVQDYLTFKIDDSNIETVSVYSTTGGLIESRKVMQGVNIIPINLGPGLYFITEENNGGSIQFIVQ